MTTTDVTTVANTTTAPVAVDPAAIMGSAVSIVKTYLVTNSVPHNELPDLIRSVFKAICEPVAGIDLDAAVDVQGEVAEIIVAEQDSGIAQYRFSDISRDPIIPVEDSVQNDVLVCLIDGVKKKMLKRHLRAKYGMEWSDYVAHFGLGKDYPSVAPGYAATKAEEARKIGLGSKIDKTPKTLGNVTVRKRPQLAVAA